MLLEGRTPGEWMRAHLHADAGADLGRWVDLEGLLGDHGTLVEMYRRLQEDRGVPAPAASTYVAGWTAGLLARVVGFALATSGAALLADRRSVRWRLHPEGWPDRVEFGRPGVVVAPDHPWRGQPGVATAVDSDAVAACAVGGLVEVLASVIDRCRRLAPVGRIGLWNEVGDGLGTAVAYHPGAPVDGAAADALATAVRVPDPPWKSKPLLRVVDSAIGPMYVARKGGCCLSYTAPDELPPDSELPEIYRAYLARFPDDGSPRYCSNCSFRDMADCQARQVFWAELEHRFSSAHQPR